MPYSMGIGILGVRAVPLFSTLGLPRLWLMLRKAAAPPRNVKMQNSIQLLLYGFPITLQDRTIVSAALKI
jgi:hypothetical protein